MKHSPAVCTLVRQLTAGVDKGEALQVGGDFVLDRLLDQSRRIDQQLARRESRRRLKHGQAEQQVEEAEQQAEEAEGR